MNVQAAMLVGVLIGLLLGAAGWAKLRSPKPRPLVPAGAAPTPDDPLIGLGRRSIESLRVGVVLLAADDTPLLVNLAARAMGLLRAGAAPGRPTAHPIVRTLAGQVRHSGTRREMELELPRGGSGTHIEPLGVQLRAVALGGGLVCVEAVDVTEAHRVARVRRDFVANVSHELKTPIGALQLLAEALLDATSAAAERSAAAGGAARPEPPAPGGGTGAPIGGAARSDTPAPEDMGAAEAADAAADLAASRRFAERIHRESARLGRLVSELLELSRLQGAEPLPEPEPVAVDWVIAEAIDRARTAATTKQIELVVVGTPGLTIYGNATQFATALGNLVENAVAYSSEGSAVVVSALSDGNRIDLSVSDRGIGIAPSDLDRVFERFYRADPARSRATGGTGLGLSIVKHIATNHGGRVDVRSELGQGSTFTLRLPARPPGATLSLPQSPEIEPRPAPAGPLDH